METNEQKEARLAAKALLKADPGLQSLVVSEEGRREIQN